MGLVAGAGWGTRTGGGDGADRPVDVDVGQQVAGNVVAVAFVVLTVVDGLMVPEEEPQVGAGGAAEGQVPVGRVGVGVVDLVIVTFQFGNAARKR